MKEGQPQNPLKNPELGALICEGITASINLDIVGTDHLLDSFAHLNSGSIIVYGLPHTTIWDPSIVTQRIINPYLKSAESEHKWMASAKFSPQFITDFSLPWSMYRAQVAEAYARRNGIQNIHVLQPHLLKKEPALKGKKMIMKEFNENATSMLKKHVSQKGAIASIFLEGTRNDKGGLLRAHKGIEDIMEDPNVLALPITLLGAHRIQHPSKKGFRGVHPFTHVTACIGDLISLNQAQELAQAHRWQEQRMGPFGVADALMLHALRSVDFQLPTILPGVNPLGFYAPENICTLS